MIDPITDTRPDANARWVVEAKQQLRRSMHSTRKLLKGQPLTERSTALISNIDTLVCHLTQSGQLRHIECAAVFLPFGSEPQLQPLLSRWLGQNVQLFAPRLDPKNDTIKFSRWDSSSQLEPMPLGYSQPSALIEPSHLDIILVPALAVDLTGHRLGYGKGYYDTLLSAYKGLRIAVVFDFQVVAEVPHESHDVQVDRIVTDKTIIEISTHDLDDQSATR